jgi:hypothetical protein
MKHQWFPWNRPARCGAPIGREQVPQSANELAAELSRQLASHLPSRRTGRSRFNTKLPRTRQQTQFNVVRLVEDLPPARPTTAEHAEVFLRHLQRRPDLQGNWVPAADVQDAYCGFCRELGWRPRSWGGRYGVAAALGRITVHRHKRIEVGDETRDMKLYLVPNQPIGSNVGSAPTSPHF